MPLDPRIALMGQNLDVGKAFNSALTNIQGMNNIKAQEQTALQTKELQKEKSMVNFSFQAGQFLENGDIEGAMNFTQNRINTLNANGIDSTDTQEFATALKSNPEQAKQLTRQGVEYGKAKGFFNNNQGQSAGQREFNSLLTLAQDPNATEFEKNSAKVALGQLARVSTSAQERIANDDNLAGRVGDSQAGIEGKKSSAKEKGKSIQQLNYKGRIAKTVKLAELEAKEKGEVLTDLARMESALPGLMESTSELKELAQIATSTLGGKAYDFIVKQSGFGGTKGATARDKFIAVIDNQVLPLLKETFGAAFTVQEGENLKATMGDPDASVESKLAQIDSFIEQKTRNIRAKKAQLEPQLKQQGITEDDITTTMQIHGMTREEVLARLGVQ